MQMLRKIRRRISILKEDYDRALYTEMMHLRDVAAFLQADANAWLEFCRDEYWQKKAVRDQPKLKAPEDALRFAVLLLCSSVKKENRKNRVNRYFAALRELDARSIPIADTIEAMDKARGFSGLGRAWTARQASARAEVGFVADAKGKTNETVGGKKAPPKGPSTSKPVANSFNDSAESPVRPDGKCKTKPDVTADTKPKRNVKAFLQASGVVRQMLRKGPGYRRKLIVTIEGMRDGVPVLSLKKQE